MNSNVDTESLIGKKYTDIKNLLGTGIRNVIINGQYQLVTQDERPSRLNVETKDGIIVKIVGWY